MFILSFNFVIVCGFLEWKRICAGFFKSFVYIGISVGDPIMKRGDLASHYSVASKSKEINYIRGRLTDRSDKSMRNMNHNHRKMWAKHKLSVCHFKTNSILPQQINPRNMSSSIGNMYTLVCTRLWHKSMFTCLITNQFMWRLLTAMFKQHVHMIWNWGCWPVPV